MLIWMRHPHPAFQLMKQNLQNRNGRDILQVAIGPRQRPEQILNELARLGLAGGF